MCRGQSLLAIEQSRALPLQEPSVLNSLDTPALREEGTSRSLPSGPRRPRCALLVVLGFICVIALFGLWTGPDDRG